MYTNNDLLFPNYVIPLLRDRRGTDWHRLVDRVMSLPDSHPEVAAFVLMMIRLNDCLECETDSYRAMRGCAMCAAQTLRRYKGQDSSLLAAYEAALEDVNAFLASQVQEKIA